MANSQEIIYEALTHLFNLKGDVNTEHLDTLLYQFHDQLVRDYNETNADTRWFEEYDGNNFNPKFEQWAVDRICNLFN